MSRGSYNGGSSLIGWSSQGYRDKLKSKPKKLKPHTGLGRLAATAATKGHINRDDLIVFGRTSEERNAFVERLRPVVEEIMGGDKDGPYHLAAQLNAMKITTAQGGRWGLRRVTVLLRLLDDRDA